MKKLIGFILVLVMIFACSTTALAYTVTARPEAEGTGTVTGSGEYSSGQNATLTATPADGYVFVGWYREDNLDTPVSTNPELVYELEMDRTYIAKFEKQYSVTLEATPSEGGTVTQSGDVYALDSSVTVTATPSANYNFLGWYQSDDLQADPVSTDLSYTFNIQEDMKLTAKFATSYALDLIVSPEGAGTVTGGGTFAAGTAVTVTATPADNYRFAGWYNISSPGTIISTDTEYNLNMDENRSLGAMFERSYGYTILWILLWIGIGFGVFVVVMRTIRYFRIVRRRRRRRPSARPPRSRY
ncbi:MAG: InlB B-repeat-containing protein [Christensenella sp.]|nr:InlB B-repeat-containing protein [Christensenella sp.]